MKIGFDVVGIVNEAKMPDQLLIFNPDLILTAGRGGKVSAPSVAQKLKENSRFLGKVMLLLPHSQRPTTDELTKIRMDMLVELPCPVVKLIQSIAKLLKMDGRLLLEKYHRARAEEGASAEELAQLLLPPDKASRYEKAMKGIEIDPLKTNFDHQKIKDAQEALKKGWDKDELAKQDLLKKSFVEALFKK